MNETAADNAPPRMPTTTPTTRPAGRPAARIAELREAIDHLNGRILALVQRRAALVAEIAVHKRSLGREGHDPNREEDMLRRLTAEPSGPFGPAEVRTVFRAIFRASLALQDRLLKGRMP